MPKAKAQEQTPGSQEGMRQLEDELKQSAPVDLFEEAWESAWEENAHPVELKTAARWGYDLARDHVRKDLMRIELMRRMTTLPYVDAGFDQTLDEAVSYANTTMGYLDDGDMTAELFNKNMDLILGYLDSTPYAIKI